MHDVESEAASEVATMPATPVEGPTEEEPSPLVRILSSSALLVFEPTLPLPSGVLGKADPFRDAGC